MEDDCRNVKIIIGAKSSLAQGPQRKGGGRDFGCDSNQKTAVPCRSAAFNHYNNIIFSFIFIKIQNPETQHMSIMI